MSQITLQTLDFSSLGFPDVGYFYLGVDTDGIPKLRRHTDTIPLYATGSSVLSYITTTALDFINLANTNSLNPGSVYLLSDFETKHYIQYTDANGDGTANDELVNVGNVEPLVIVAISNSQYNIDVKSLNYPDDEIVWRHDLADREREYYNPGGLGKGYITYRKSASGNSRDYDFRNVIFRRWNDGSGNYTVVRAADAPNIFDYIDFKSFEEGFVDPFLKNEISSFTSLSNGFGVPYYLDNLVISTFSIAFSNKINIAHGVTINTPNFAENQIGIILYSTIHDTSSQMVLNKINNLVNSNIFGDFQINDVSYINSSTFSNIFYSNRMSVFTNCIVGTAQGNNISGVDNSTFQNLISNTGNLIKDSVIETFESNNFNTVQYSNLTSFTFNDVNVVGTNTVGTVSGNIVNTLNGNTCSQIVDNISVEIKDNVVPNIYNNTIDLVVENILTGDIYYNIGSSITQNVGSMSILSNRVNLLYQNTGSGTISYNSSDEIFDNTLNNAFITSNTVKVINSNTIYNSLNFNVGHSIVSNTASFIDSNNVLEIEDNILGTFSYNIGSEFKFNSITQSNYNSITTTTNNNINTFEYNSGILFDSNVGNTFSDNQIDGASNNTINYVAANKIFNLELNTINYLGSNQAWKILSNTASEITYNKSLIIFNNISSTIDSNDIHSIQNNIVGTISNNVGQTIQDNNIDIITGNIIQSIQSNLSGLTYSEISDNNVREINNNTNLSYFSLNVGDSISSNTFNASYSIVVSNNVNTISGNTNCSIQSNNVNSINDNTNVSFIESNTMNSINNNSNFYNIEDSTGKKISGCTGSTGSSILILQELHNVNFNQVLVNTNVQSHTFLDSLSFVSLTASTDMQTGTYSTVSRWVWDLSGHYEEKALSIGLTYSGPIA
jgi:hypothetical protein